MTISFSRFCSRHSFLPIALAALTGFWPSAVAQTAPQLLPYTVKLIAGGATTNPAKGATCPLSGFTSTDAFGDGCLATEIQLASIAATNVNGTGPHEAVVDKTGTVFFVDGTNGLVRRIDPITGVVTAVAGGAASSPASGTACGTGVSTDAMGDGCPATLVKLSRPISLVFSPSGDLYFGDYGTATVRKIAATGGVITTTGIISMVDGQPTGTFGYTSNFGSTTVVAATAGYLDAPFALAFDNNGNLYIADEFKNAVVVVNTNATTTTTVTGISIPPGTVVKIFGTPTTNGPACPNSPASPNGCNFGMSIFGGPANSSPIDNPYGLTLDSSGNVYIAVEFYNFIGKISTTGTLTSFAGIQASGAKTLKRGPAGSFGIGSVFGIAADANNNFYVADASSGVIWRIDGAAGNTMYVLAGGATTVCSGATDTYGDGCSAPQSIFGSSSGTATFASTKSPGPGIFGISVDANSDLFVGDTETGLIREVASGTQFGNVGATQTDVVDVHFAANDSAAANGYTITAGGSIFSLGTPSCTANSDLTMDCLLPITVTPSVLGSFTGTLQVQAQLGGISTFPLSGNFVQSPVTRTVVSAAGSAACIGTTTYSTTAVTTFSASLVANGPSNPGGTITFYANGVALAPANIPVVNIGTAAAPVYGATLSYTFSTPATYAVTATYSGDSYFKTSTSVAPASVTTALPTFAAAAVSYQQSTVNAGQTALYSFNLAQTVYSGTISFAVSGLPANTSYVINPSTITATGCTASSTVALSILTQQGSSASQSSIGLGGKGIWGGLTSLLGMVLALAVGLRRRRTPLRYGQIWMMLALLLAASGTIACGKAVTAAGRTPAGSYNITVTATGSTGTTSTVTFPLNVN